MVKNFLVALALIGSLAAAGCSGGTGGALPPTSPAIAQGSQPVAQTRHATDAGGGIGDGTVTGFAIRTLHPVVGPTATPPPCKDC